MKNTVMDKTHPDTVEELESMLAQVFHCVGGPAGAYYACGQTREEYITLGYDMADDAGSAMTAVHLMWNDFADIYRSCHEDKPLLVWRIRPEVRVQLARPAQWDKEDLVMEPALPARKVLYCRYSVPGLPKREKDDTFSRRVKEAFDEQYAKHTTQFQAMAPTTAPSEPVPWYRRWFSWRDHK